jgi:pilus assembly protein TadC
VAGHVLQWEQTNQKKPYKILLLGLAAMAAVGIGRKEDLRKARAQRNALLLAEYPQMLSQMALLLGAGMTVSMAWERIVLGYESRAGDLLPLPIYEEMSITYRQMKDGMSERLAYEQFGERLQLSVYRRFSTLLVQNLRKGTVGLASLLEKEMQEAYDTQESNAKKRGEELQTKLLLPMMLMLGLVIVIIMIPAVSSFSV